MIEQITENPNHKAGFVSIIGKPNVGKSTLMNRLVGERLSIITSKAQTTRHRIMGIINSPDFQIVYSDTPGIIEPKYALHKAMMGFVYSSLEDADVILFVTDIHERYDEDDVLKKLKVITTPIILIINKIDTATQEQVDEKIAYWKEHINATEIIAISALNDFNTAGVLEHIISRIPIHPAYFDKDSLTDKSERFFAAEIIREKIFLNFDKEIPYSCEVQITEFKDEPNIIRIRAEILVERDSQKGILIGKGGTALKKIGQDARQDMEKFFQKHIFLEQHVKVEKDWRKVDKQLSRFGYRD